MKIICGTLTAAAVMFATVPAFALSITNLDAETRRLEIVQGSETRTIELAPQQRLDGLCSERCQVTIEGDPDPYDLETTDVVQIEEGQLYFQDDANTGSGENKPQ